MSSDPQVPTLEEVQRLALTLGMTLTDVEIDSYRNMMRTAFVSCRRLYELPEWKPPVKYPRGQGYRPSREDNPYNAWHWRTDIKGASSGPLNGVRIGVKDSFCVAGIPMTGGSRVLEGFVPDIDATIVTRLLDAGATIVGKTTSASGVGTRGDNNDIFGTVRNPRKPTHAPGGSSNGSAAALAAGDVQMTLGADQGGSIRIPAAWSGVVGLKPTYGLVPYTGCVSNEMTMVHAGPMATTVADVARLLSAIAGPDPLDPRQRGVISPVTDYTTTIGRGVRGLRIGVVLEGFGQPAWDDIGLLGSEEIVDRKVRSACRALERRGAVVAEVSIPMHLDGVHIFNGMYNEGNAHMYRNHNVGTNWSGFYNTKLLEGEGWRSRPNDLSPSVKAMLLTAEYLDRRYRGRYYARAQNLRSLLRNAYDEVLASYDILAMPTVPCRATPIPPPEITPQESVAFAMQMINNTCQFGVTGHPAISVPCGMAEDLPIGLMLVGRHLDELTVLRVADAFEQVGDWQTM